MAKGNNGNYLQHSLEVEAALQLAATDKARRLHVALAHGMAPFEALEKPPSGQTHGHLDLALIDSHAPPHAGESAVVTAYRSAKASAQHYPNSAELLRAIIGVNSLSGGITEVDPNKHERLAHAWSGSRVVPVQSSWRSQVGPDGILNCPVGLEVPWLFTLDPMTYSEDGEADGANVNRADLDLLSEVLTRFVTSGQPGIAALFVYAVWPKTRLLFWAFVDELAKRTDTTAITYWLTHQGGNRNLAGLFCPNVGLSAGATPSGVTMGR